VALRPPLYHALAEIGSRVLGWAGGGRGRFRSLPLAGGWTEVRDMPAPEGRSFHSLWAEHIKTQGRE
jgi:L-lactate dehydrogenase complex protein LldF